MFFLSTEWKCSSSGIKFVSPILHTGLTLAKSDRIFEQIGWKLFRGYTVTRFWSYRVTRLHGYMVTRLHCKPYDPNFVQPKVVFFRKFQSEEKPTPKFLGAESLIVEFPFPENISFTGKKFCTFEIHSAELFSAELSVAWNSVI